MKDKIDCHTATPKQDLIDFVERHKGEKIFLHFEYDYTNRWGQGFSKASLSV